MPILIPKPEYPVKFDFVDEDCKFLATYLYEQLNETFYNALKSNIVNSVRYENDLFIPVVDFPVLKVYKTAYEDSADIAPHISCKFNISYALAYTQRDKIASVGSYVAQEIRRLLKNGSMNDLFQLDWTQPIQVEFEDFINPENVVYKYANITCNIFIIGS